MANKKGNKERTTVDGADAKVVINIYSPGHAPEECRLTLPNITGTANLLHRNPEAIKAAIRAGLVGKFGGRVE